MDDKIKNKLEKLRHDWKLGQGYWNGDNDDGDAECGRCLNKHMPEMLSVVIAAVNREVALNAFWEEKVPYDQARTAESAKELSEAVVRFLKDDLS